MNSLGKELKIACRDGNLDVVRSVLNTEPTLIKLTYGYLEETLLHIAAKYESLVVVQELLKHGAQVETKDNNGETPLHTATWTGHLAIVQELLQHEAKVEANDKYGWTPLHIAAQDGHLTVVQELIRHGALVEAKTVVGAWTPLFCAAVTGKLTVVQELVEKYGARVNIKNNDGKSPLDVANGHNHVVSYLETAKQHCDQLESIFWVFVYEHTRARKQQRVSK